MWRGLHTLHQLPCRREFLSVCVCQVWRVVAAFFSLWVHCTDPKHSNTCHLLRPSAGWLPLA